VSFPSHEEYAEARRDALALLRASLAGDHEGALEKIPCHLSPLRATNDDQSFSSSEPVSG
jgi:hypothetical protein